MANHSSDRETDQPRLYNPYLSNGEPFLRSSSPIAIGRDLPNLYRDFQLPTSPEFLFEEDATRQRRSWGEKLTFYTGCSYLAGAVGGGSTGFVSGVKSFEPGDTTKLRINRILNSSGHSGRLWGNRIGVIGLMYAGLESGTEALRDKDDMWNCVAAGLGTGALYRAARGVRSAAVAGAIGGALAGVAVAGKQILKRYVPI